MALSKTDTIGTFRISLHNFIFGLLICEMISRLISQKSYWRIILWNFLRSFHKFRCDPVVACGGVAVFIQESAKAWNYFTIDFSQFIFYFTDQYFWELFCEKCCAVFTTHFTEKCLGIDCEIQGVSTVYRHRLDLGLAILPDHGLSCFKGFLPVDKQGQGGSVQRLFAHGMARVVLVLGSDGFLLGARFLGGSFWQTSTVPLPVSWADHPREFTRTLLPARSLLIFCDFLLISSDVLLIFCSFLVITVNRLLIVC